MYYIMSPVTFENLQQYHVPKFSNEQQFEEFYQSDIGKEFHSIAPIRIMRVSNRNEFFWEVSTDIAWVGCVYNCPLHIYVMKDKVFAKEFNFGFAEYVNFGKCKAMEGTEKDYSVCLPKEQMYFGGDLDTVMRAVYENMRFKLTNDKSIVHYLIQENEIKLMEE